MITIGCPSNQTAVNCSNPCLTSTCPSAPTAKCVPDYCGQCKSRYFYQDKEVTDTCCKEL